jgi:hypothetical protein
MRGNKAEVLTVQPTMTIERPIRTEADHAHATTEIRRLWGSAAVAAEPPASHVLRTTPRRLNPWLKFPSHSTIC